ncbi:MAG TPA: TetR/AcrR family transcriptional regulator [Acidimicrobiales bacterium]|nr:TetR/AcrR family transcriptional regulator [Acidimicrobiales bacterium]
MARLSREGRAPDRAATEAALERAALELLDRNGVLAGLNLREVAAEAGVNRGLVYHYFGSRRDLLRAALGSDVRERMHDLAQATHGGLRNRFANFFRTMLGHRRAVVLSALLVLDGDRDVRFDVDATRRRRRFALSIERGEAPEGLDGDAYWVATSSLIYGYGIFRTRFAEELGLDPDELDERVLATVDRLIAGLASQPAPTA